MLWFQHAHDGMSLKASNVASMNFAHHSATRSPYIFPWDVISECLFTAPKNTSATSLTFVREGALRIVVLTRILAEAQESI